MHPGRPVGAGPLARASLVLLLLFASAAAAAGPPATGPPATKRTARTDSIPATDLIQPGDLARALAGPASGRPTLVHVGFEVLYRGGHIPGSKYAGPASKPGGLAALKRALKPLPRQTPIVLYCGCCPWSDCPNVRPAFRAARALGFKHVRVLVISKTFKEDWIDRKLPVAEGGS